MEKSGFHCQKNFNLGAREGWKEERSIGNDSKTAELGKTAEKSLRCRREVDFLTKLC